MGRKWKKITTQKKQQHRKYARAHTPNKSERNEMKFKNFDRFSAHRQHIHSEKKKHNTLNEKSYYFFLYVRQMTSKQHPINKNKTFKLQIFFFVNKLFRICKFIARLINVYTKCGKKWWGNLYKGRMMFCFLLLLFGMKNDVFRVLR